MIDMNEYIQLAFVKRKTNERQIALSMGESPQNINRKLKSDMKLSFIKRIADTLECDVEIKFIDKASGKELV